MVHKKLFIEKLRGGPKTILFNMFEINNVLMFLDEYQTRISELIFNNLVQTGGNKNYILIIILIINLNI